MKRMFRVLVAATTVSGVMAAPALAVDRSGLKLDDVVAAGAVGALAEVRDEHGVRRATSGVAELGTTKAVPANGRFRAGSITKTFLAVVVLQLVEDGRLRLDDPVERWLPGVVPGGDKITVRHLLNHTSGLYDYKRTLPMPPDPAFYANRWRTWTAAELIQRAVAEPPTNQQPGKVYAYTNTGYALLGQIVEKATGHSYATEIKRRLIWPLGLSGTKMPGTSPWIPGPHPHGYVPSEQGLVDFTAMNPSVLGASGELISTTRDLNRFFAVLLRGHLLPDHLLAEMKTQGVEGGKQYGLGLAWWDTSCGIRVYGNDGDALAYQAWSFATEDGRTQATIALTPRHSADLDDVVDAFLDRAFCG
jgi:D-alanyl-D-alanine carboxypeptidase